jgi:hypothetical protein
MVLTQAVLTQAVLTQAVLIPAVLLQGSTARIVQSGIPLTLQLADASLRI